MTAQPRHIRLELAREAGHPHGDARIGYDIVAFLDDDGRLDLEACKAEAARCHVRRFVQDATVATGRLRHTVGNRWVLDFEGGDRDDVVGHRLGDERFVLGEYVSVTGVDGITHTYGVERIAEV